LLWQALVSGFSIGIALVVPVGPTCLETVKRTAVLGYYSGISVAFGAILADLLILLTILFGIDTLALRYINRRIFSIVGFSTLTFLGITSIWKGVSKTELCLKNEEETICLNPQGDDDRVILSFSDCLNSFGTGFFLTIINPSNAVLWLVLVGTVINPWLNKGSLSIATFIFALIAGMLIWYHSLAVIVLNSLDRFRLNRLKINFYSGILMLIFAFYFAFDTLFNKVHLTGIYFK